MECSEESYARRDPLKIKELEWLTANPEKLLRVFKEENKTGYNREPFRKKPKPHTLSKASIAREKTRGEFMNESKKATGASRRFILPHELLPTDLILIIADMLPGEPDFRRLMEAFPLWSAVIPHSYWRSRLSKDELLFIEEIPRANNVDWRFIYLNIDHLLGNSHGWKNRRRIMKILQKTKDGFLKLLSAAQTGRAPY